MGTYYTPGASRADVIAELLTTQPYTNAENKTIQRRILAHCLKGNILWTVNEVLIDGALADRWIGCDLLVCYRRNGATTWGYKPMDEDSHPYYYTCPLRYLELASPHDGSQYSTEWREEVRAYWAEVATRRTSRTPGQFIPCVPEGRNGVARAVCASCAHMKTTIENKELVIRIPLQKPTETQRIRQDPRRRIHPPQPQDRRSGELEGGDGRRQRM